MAAATTWPIIDAGPHNEDRNRSAYGPHLRTGYAGRLDRKDRTDRWHVDQTETGDRLTTRQSLERDRGDEAEPILVCEQRAGMAPFDRSHTATDCGRRVRHASRTAADNVRGAAGYPSDDPRAAAAEASARLVPRASWSIGNRDCDPTDGAEPVATAQSTSAVVCENPPEPVAPLLTDTELARVRAEHSIVDVLGRLGINPPARWDGAADFMISCPTRGHRDSTPSCIVHPQTDRWHCFGCGAGGDVLELVRQVEGVSSLRTIAGILYSRRPLHPGSLAHGAGPRVPARSAGLAAERPDPNRTPYQGVMSVNAAAWRYLSLPKLAERGRAYLHSRGIDVTALETEQCQPVAGHTPYQHDGLVTHLRSRGFTDDEIVDAGWGARRDGQLTDRFRHRVIIPVRDPNGRVIGVYGRDVTGTASQKYLNTAETIAFHKGSTVYRPSVTPLDAHATVVVCEGSLDALAIAANAAHVGKSRYYAPVSPSGTALTATQAALVLAISDRATLVCADGDEPGIAAAEKWIRSLMSHGRETIVTVLPDGHDPASWLRERGTAALCAFTRKGCLDLPDDAVKPTPAGGLLAERILTGHVAAARRHDPNTETVMVLPTVIRQLAAEAFNVSGEAATRRFATAAGQALARLADGVNAEGRTHELLTAVRGHTETMSSKPCQQSVDPAPRQQSLTDASRVQVGF